MRYLVPLSCLLMLSACSAKPDVSGGGDSGPALGDSGQDDAGPRAEVDAGPRNGSGEVCDNGLDDNGDGRVDEDCECDPGGDQRCYRGDPELAGIGACTWGAQACIAGLEFSTWDLCVGDGSPSEEVCDGVDNNCDGTVDEGCECRLDETRSCYTGPAGTEGVGVCREGTEACLEVSGGSIWNGCEGSIVPGIESCELDGDEDCDGMIDEGCACSLGTSRGCWGGSAATRGVGECTDGNQACVGDSSSTGWATCRDEIRPRGEICTGGRDDDCDGLIDCADPDCSATCCSPYSERLAVVPAEGELFFAIDRSGSMDWLASTGNTRWQELKTAMASFLPMASDLHLGMLTFPEMDGTVERDNCDVAAGPDIPMGLGNHAAILDRLIVVDPRAGDTPTPSAVGSVGSYLSTLTSSRERFLILATDGLPEPNCGASVAATVAAIADLRSSYGIDTFVVGIVGPHGDDYSGIPALQAALNQMADAGGRARSGGIRYYEAVEASALTSAFRSIVASATNCRFTLSSPPARPANIEVRQNGALVPSSTYSLSGTTLQFSGTSCDRIQNGLVSSIDVEDTCD